jgi:hypothetical protein
MIRKVTLACLRMSGDGTTVYGIYRGRLQVVFRDVHASYFDCHRAEHVGDFTCASGLKPDLLALARKHETLEFPAFDWPMLEDIARACLTKGSKP